MIKIIAFLFAFLSINIQGFVINEHEYGVADTIQLLVFDTNAQFLQETITWATGDIKISKDNDTYANTSSLPTLNGQTWTLALTAAELQCQRYTIYYSDQSADEFADGGIQGYTYGDSSSLIEYYPANLMSIRSNDSSAIKLRYSTDEMYLGTASSGTLSTTQMSTDISETTASHWVGRVIIWTSGTLRGQATSITAYDGAGLFTFTSVTEAPLAGDTFIII